MLRTQEVAKVDEITVIVQGEPYAIERTGHGFNGFGQPFFTVASEWQEDVAGIVVTITTDDRERKGYVVDFGQPVKREVRNAAGEWTDATCPDPAEVLARIRSGSAPTE
jgi:hypothetical protein